MGIYCVRDMVKEHGDSQRRNTSHYMGYSFWLAASDLLYAPSHRQKSTFHGLCYASYGVTAGKRNSSIGPPLIHRIKTPHHSIKNTSLDLFSGFFPILTKASWLVYHERNSCLWESAYKSSQVRSGLTWTFKGSCYSTRLSWAQIPLMSWAVCLGQ